MLVLKDSQCQCDKGVTVRVRSRKFVDLYAYVRTIHAGVNF